MPTPETGNRAGAIKQDKHDEAESEAFHSYPGFVIAHIPCCSGFRAEIKCHFYSLLVATERLSMLLSHSLPSELMMDELSDCPKILPCVNSIPGSILQIQLYLSNTNP